MRCNRCIIEYLKKKLNSLQTDELHCLQAFGQLNAGIYNIHCIFIIGHVGSHVIIRSVEVMILCKLPMAAVNHY